jgi:hypothetical protein
MSLVILAVMIAIGGFAYLRIAPGTSAIPMQWSLRGEVKWSAPRAAAFAFVPGLSIVICAIFAASGMIALFAITGSVLLICQIIHILLVRRWAAARQM